MSAMNTEGPISLYLAIGSTKVSCRERSRKKRSGTKTINALMADGISVPNRNSIRFRQQV